MKKPGLLSLLCICAAVSVAGAQITPTPISPRPVSVPEIQWSEAGSAVIALVGVIAIARGRRKD